MIEQPADEQRRGNLRAFLTERRARLQPSDVGLPATSRRRVPGLRREEVAELAGVSSDWYRGFESGRQVRVSPQFVARLSRVLKLGDFEQRILYRLALPELYETDAALQPTPGGRSLLSPVESLSDIEPAQRKVATAREGFLAGAPAARLVRPRIVGSWRRSEAAGVDPQHTSIPAVALAGAALQALRNASQPLLRAFGPVRARLTSLLPGYAVAVANASGYVIELGGAPEVLAALAEINFVPGVAASEALCGTTSVGTCLVDGRPLQLIGAEHYCAGGIELTGTSAPVRDPSTRDIIGALDLVGPYGRIRPELLMLLAQFVLEIEERLAASQSRE